MTKIEKLVLALIVVCCVISAAFGYTTFKQIEGVGLKVLVEQIWCGKSGCTK
jgi:hypothetical protein